MIESFLLPAGAPLPVNHTHYWESLQMAATLRELGYDVDVISYRNTTFQPRHDYSLLLGARVNFDRLAGLVGEECVKVVHLDTSHWLFNNTAAYQRHLDLARRRGVAIPIGRKQVEQNWAVENADHATVLGNDFTVGTYAYACKELHPLPIPSCRTFPEPTKDFDAVRRNYVWFGSHGLVHKGLDLVLEAFAGLPDFRLTVCGPVAADAAFSRAYARELHGLPNIETVDWVAIDSPRFERIMADSLGIVYPSAAEGQAGSVVTCLHAGLIPVLSPQAGVDVDEFGVLLRDVTVAGIREAVRELSALPAPQLRERALETWRTARATYTRERYRERHLQVMTAIVTGQARYAPGPRKNGSPAGPAAGTAKARSRR